MKRSLWRCWLKILRPIQASWPGYWHRNLVAYLRWQCRHGWRSDRFAAIAHLGLLGEKIGGEPG